MGAKHKNKRTGVIHERPRPGWTDAEIDFVLNEILPLDDPKRLYATECRIAEQLDRGRELTAQHRDYGKGHSRKPIDLLIWKLSSGYGRAAKYTPNLKIRHDRTGKPFTWMEKRILQIAFSPENDAQKERGPGNPTPGYIAMILHRPAHEISAARFNGLGEKLQTGGFGL